MISCSVVEVPGSSVNTARRTWVTVAAIASLAVVGRSRTEVVHSAVFLVDPQTFHLDDTLSSLGRAAVGRGGGTILPVAAFYAT